MIDIPRDLLADIVGRSLGRAGCSLVECFVHPINYPSVSPHSRGLFRVHGSASTTNGTTNWSVVLKTFQLVDGSPASSEANPFYWKREARAYQSGLLPHTSDGLAAPRCFGVTELSHSELWLWLEAINEPDPERWDLSRFRLAANHLGTFSSQYCSTSSLPASAWLSRGLMRAWVADSPYLIDCIQDAAVWKHPLLRNTAFASFVPAILQLWGEREAWFTRLEELPQTLCHHDMWRKNLLTRGVRGAKQQTVAIDWEAVGLGALGEDIGNLIGVSLLNCDIEAQDARHFAAALLGNYAQGLLDSGQRVNLQLMRGAAWAAAVLRCIFSAACWPAAIVRNPDSSEKFIQETEQRWERPIEAVFHQWAAVTAFLLGQAEEARTILDM